MRILVVSNYYPPYFVGGYELGCRDIVEALRRRGHEILVLTSTYGVGRKTSETGLQRQLELQNDDGDYHPRVYWREFSNRRALHRALRSFQPVIVYFWNQTSLPGSLVKIVRGAGLPYAFYISDDSLLRWRTDSLWQWWTHPPPNPIKARVKAWGERVLRKFSFIDDRAQDYYGCHRQFTSAHIQQLFVTPAGSTMDQVIPWGVDLDRFPCQPIPAERPHRLLFVGQVVAHKGVRTAIQAVQILRDHFHVADTTLTIVGGTTTPEFLAEMRQLVASEKLDNCVIFLGKVDRERLPAIYQQHHLLIFPSEWEEPFAITPLEAMASGLPVIGTLTGGSKEIFEPGETAMIFAPGDAAGCAAAIHVLLGDSALYHALRGRGRQLVEERYSLVRMVASIERHLGEVLACSSLSSPALVRP